MNDSTSIADLQSLINSQIKAHEELNHHLTHIEYLFNFMLAIDFSQTQPAELRAQFVSMRQLVNNTKTMNQALQAALLDQALPQLINIKKQA